MEKTKFCDLRTCNKVCGVEPTFTPDKEKVKAYAGTTIRDSVLTNSER